MGDAAPGRRARAAVAACALGAAALLAWTAREVVGAYLFERSTFSPPRTAPARPVDLAAEDVELRLADGTPVRGWWIPSRSGAAVVIAHGSSADRAAMLPEARALAGCGFGALLWDSPGHGESGGRVRWGEPERDAVRAAVAWVASRPGVEPGRIGALGFSLGSAIVLAAAADEPRLRAVALEGAFPAWDAQLRGEFSRHLLSGAAAVIAARAAGADPAALRPARDVARLAGRPLLFVAGSDDHAVPLALTEELYRAAPGPKELWVLPGAHHGDYAAVAGGAYRARLCAFFRGALAR